MYAAIFNLIVNLNFDNSNDAKLCRNNFIFIINGLRKYFKEQALQKILETRFFPHYSEPIRFGQYFILKRRNSALSGKVDFNSKAVLAFCMLCRLTTPFSGFEYVHNVV